MFASDPAKLPRMRQLADDYWLLLALDQPETIGMLPQADLAPLGLTAGEAVALGTANTLGEAGAPQPPLEVLSVGDTGVHAGGAYESSRLLGAAAWAELARAQGGSLVVAAPAADRIFYGLRDSPQALAALDALAREQ